MRKWLLLNLLMAAHLSILSQEKLSGRIRDWASGNAISQVYIETTNGEARDLTNDRGEFNLVVAKLPVTLAVHALGYRDTLVVVSSLRLIRIDLREESYQILGVEIQAEKSEVIAGNQHRSIWDYAWYDGNLMLCEYGLSLGDARIVAVNSNLDTIAKAAVPGRPVALFTDCLGLPHIQGKKETWQFYPMGGLIHFLPPEPNHLVNNLLKTCMASDDQNMYFAYPQGIMQSKTQNEVEYNFTTSSTELFYYFGNKSNNKLNFLTKIQDDAAQAMISEEYMKGKRSHGGAPSKSFPARSETAHSAAASRLFLYKILIKDIYAPLFAQNDSVYLLDHIHDNIAVFDKTGELLRLSKLNYPKSAKFIRLCIKDDQNDDVFSCFDQDGLVVLKKLDLATGQLSGATVIPYPFVEHLTIHDGFVYYLRRDETNHEVRLLGRTKL
jgi:hypothetical protein